MKDQSNNFLVDPRRLDQLQKKLDFACPLFIIKAPPLPALEKSFFMCEKGQVYEF